MNGKLPDVSGYREKPGYAVHRRLRRRLLRALSLWWRKDYDIRFLQAEGQTRYKKVIFNSSDRAIRACDELESFGPSRHFPRLVGRSGNEVWVEFVDGSVLRTIDDDTISRLTDFYAAVYRHGPRLVALSQTTLVPQFNDNLSCLLQQGLLDSSTYEALRQEHSVRTPEQVWIGFDYTDPIKSNLVVKHGDQDICAVDIKNLKSETLIGQGIVKASRRWLSDTLMATFFEQLRHKGAPDFQSYFPYIRIFDSVQRIRGKIYAENRLTSNRKLRRMRRNKPDFAEFV